MTVRRVLVPCALSPAGLGASPAGAQIERLDGRAMGTSWSVVLLRPPGAAAAGLKAGIESELDRIVAQMSTWRADSDIGRFNRAPAGTWQALPADFLAVLDYALAVAQATGGAYDPAAGRLVDLWGFGPRPPGAAPPAAVPDAAAVAAARAAGGWRRLGFDRAGARVRQPGGLRLDLSAVAKGHAVDCVARFLQAAGVESFLVEVGGELRGRGAKPDGQPWWVAVERPDGDAGTATVVALHDLAVATSGDYRRFFVAGGGRYSHTIDPRDGRPVRHALAAVSVLHPSCMCADALSTALTVLGPEAGMDWAVRHDIAALLVLRAPGGGFEERLSPALARMQD